MFCTGVNEERIKTRYRDLRNWLESAFARLKNELSKFSNATSSGNSNKDGTLFREFSGACGLAMSSSNSGFASSADAKCRFKKDSAEWVHFLNQSRNKPRQVVSERVK